MYAMLSLSLSLSDTLRRRRPAYADPLNKLARAASGEDIRSKEKEEERVSPPRDETPEKSIRAISRMLRWQPRNPASDRHRGPSSRLAISRVSKLESRSMVFGPFES